MKAIDAIIQVLSDSSAPLHYSDIWRRIQARRLWETTGKTPEATISARLSLEVNRTDRPPRICRVGRGTYELLDSNARPTAVAYATQRRRRLSFTDAAEQVLLRSGTREPMHYRDITERALGDGLIVTRGKTPAATMYAQLYSEIKRATKRGERPRFIRLGKGFFTLTRWQSDRLATQIDRHNQRVRSALLQELREMDPFEFEELVGRVLTDLGFELIEVTSPTSDGGIDIRGTLVVGDVIRTRMAIQVKRWKRNIHSPIIQQVRGSLGALEQGLIITTSDFSSGAREEAERLDATPVALMSGEQLVRVMIEHDIGVRRSSHDIIELGEFEAWAHQNGESPSVVD